MKVNDKINKNKIQKGAIRVGAVRGAQSKLKITYLRCF